MRKAIILTFSKVYNRGANMQCYAMMRILQKKGYDVRFLDAQLPKSKMNIKGFLFHLISNFKVASFRKRNGFQYTSKFTSYKELVNNPPQADVLIIGSDQVWNNRITKVFDPRIYYGGFVHGIKKIAYAASFGKNEWESTPFDEEIKFAAQELDYISVREDFGIHLCDEVFGRKDAVCVVDPTLLLSKDDILRCIDKQRGSRKFPFTYVYLLHQDDNIIKIVNYLFSLKNNKVLGFHQHWGLKNLFEITSISEWLSNIRDADCVITNSFHCMVMCILLHKEFYVTPTFPGLEVRITSLLNKLNIPERYISSVQTIDLLGMIDYESVDKNLNQLKKQAMSFLTNSLK